MSDHQNTTEPDAPPSSPEAPRAPIPVIPPDWFKKTSNPRPQLFYNRLIIGLTLSALAAAVVLVFRELW